MVGEVEEEVEDDLRKILFLHLSLLVHLLLYLHLSLLDHLLLYLHLSLRDHLLPHLLEHVPINLLRMRRRTAAYPYKTFLLMHHQSNHRDLNRSAVYVSVNDVTG